MNTRLRKLKQIDRKIPFIECKGLCYDSCTVIGMSELEMKNINEVSGKEIFKSIEETIEKLKNAKSNSDLRCPMLSDDNRCSVYENRPLICRLYGVVKN